MNESKFFKFGKINQPVNTWLCILLMASMCYWTVSYFFRHINTVINNTYASSETSAVDGF
jgi:hypothetical protein